MHSVHSPGHAPRGGTLARRAPSSALLNSCPTKGPTPCGASLSTPLLRTFPPRPSSLAASALSLSLRFCTSRCGFVCVSARDLLCFPNPLTCHLLLFFPLGSDTCYLHQLLPPTSPLRPGIRVPVPGGQTGTGNTGMLCHSTRCPGPPAAHGKPRHHEAQDPTGSGGEGRSEGTPGKAPRRQRRGHVRSQ